jgi:hypothetical protein
MEMSEQPRSRRQTRAAILGHLLRSGGMFRPPLAKAVRLSEASLRTQGPITPGLKSEKGLGSSAGTRARAGRDERNCAHAGVPAFAGTTH